MPVLRSMGGKKERRGSMAVMACSLRRPMRRGGSTSRVSWGVSWAEGGLCFGRGGGGRGGERAEGLGGGLGGAEGLGHAGFEVDGREEGAEGVHGGDGLFFEEAHEAGAFDITDVLEVELAEAVVVFGKGEVGTGEEEAEGFVAVVEAEEVE